MRVVLVGAVKGGMCHVPMTARPRHPPSQPCAGMVRWCPGATRGQAAFTSLALRSRSNRALCEDGRKQQRRAQTAGEGERVSCPANRSYFSSRSWDQYMLVQSRGCLICCSRLVDPQATRLCVCLRRTAQGRGEQFLPIWDTPWSLCQQMSCLPGRKRRDVGHRPVVPSKLCVCVCVCVCERSQSFRSSATAKSCQLLYLGQEGTARPCNLNSCR